MTSFVYDPAVYEGTNASLTSAVSSDGWPETGKRYRIPPRCGVAVRLREGQVLSVENTHGTQVCDFWAYLASDMGSVSVNVAFPNLVAISLPKNWRRTCNEPAPTVVGNN